MVRSAARLRRWVLVILGGVALWNLWQGLDLSSEPAVTVFRDDAYYYLVWAANAAERGVAEVSPGVETSGVHLGWALLLTRCAAWFGAEALPTAAWALGLLCFLVTALLLARERGRWTAGGIAAALLWLGNPFVLREVQNGQETALGALALVVLWRLRSARTPWFVGAGVLVALARSDLLLFVVAMAMWRFVCGRKGARWAIVELGLGVAVPLGALLVLQRVQTGAFTQDSTWPIPWLMWANWSAAGATAADLPGYLWWLLRPCLLGWPWTLGGVALPATFVWASLPPSLRGARAGFALLGTVGVAVLLGMSAPWLPLAVSVLMIAGGRRAPRCESELRWLLAAGFALAVVHLVVRMYPRPYYFVPLVVGGAFAVTGLGARGMWLWLLVAVSTLLPRVGPSVKNAPEKAQEEMVMAGRFVDRFVPEDQKIGSFNSGIVTWFRPGPVFNLDGVVDRRVHPFLFDGRLSDWLDENGIHWLLDNPVQFDRDPSKLHSNGRWLGPDFDPGRDLIEVARFDVPGLDHQRPGTAEFRLYRRAGADAKPRSVAAYDDLGAAPDGGRYVLWRGGEGAVLWLVGADDEGSGIAVARGVPGVVQVLKLQPSGEEPRTWRLVERAAGSGRGGATLDTFPL